MVQEVVGEVVQLRLNWNLIQFEPVTSLHLLLELLVLQVLVLRLVSTQVLEELEGVVL
jgi:hypothetical protein